MHIIVLVFGLVTGILFHSIVYNAILSKPIHVKLIDTKTKTNELALINKEYKSRKLDSVVEKNKQISANPCEGLFFDFSDQIVCVQEIFAGLITFKPFNFSEIDPPLFQNVLAIICLPGSEEEFSPTPNMNSMQKLRFFYVVNTFYGPIGTEIGLLTDLTYWSLGDSSVNTTIQSEFGQLTQLNYFILVRNMHSGSIPSEICRLSFATVIELGSNSLCCSIPSEIGLLRSVLDLSLNNNNLTGQLPSQFGMLTSLSDLELQHNSFSTSIPSQFALLTSLKYIDLTSCGVFGTIMSEFGLLQSLSHIFLNLNSLSGTIPSEIGLLTRLIELQIQSNHFLGGTFPKEIEKLTQLAILTIDYTNIEQTIDITFINRLKKFSCENSKVIGCRQACVGCPDLSIVATSCDRHGRQSKCITPEVYFPILILSFLFSTLMLIRVINGPWSKIMTPLFLQLFELLDLLADISFAYSTYDLISISAWVLVGISTFVNFLFFVLICRYYKEEVHTFDSVKAIQTQVTVPKGDKYYISLLLCLVNIRLLPYLVQTKTQSEKYRLNSSTIACVFLFEDLPQFILQAIALSTGNLTFLVILTLTISLLGFFKGFMTIFLAHIMSYGTFSLTTEI